MKNRITITESERKHISKLHNLKETNEYDVEKKERIINMLYAYMDNWDKYPIEYCNTTNEDDMTNIAKLICIKRREGKDLEFIYNALRQFVPMDDPRLLRYEIQKGMDGFIDT